MFSKVSVIAVIVALAVPTLASATVRIPNDDSASNAALAAKGKKNPKKAKHTQKSIGDALTIIGSTVERSSQERDGYCAPIPMPRVGENDGLFLNLYADDASRALYHAAGLVDARKDPVTGSLSC